MPSLAVHLLGHGGTAINLLDTERPTIHRDNCSFIWEHDDKSNRSLMHAPAWSLPERERERESLREYVRACVRGEGEVEPWLWLGGYFLI
jgi:hypothetical protein